MDNKEQYKIKIKVRYFGEDPRKAGFTENLLVSAESFEKALKIAQEQATMEEEDLNNMTNSQDYGAEVISISKNYYKVRF